MLTLTDSDYDPLFAAMKDDLPRMWQDIVPKILAQLEATGVLTISVTDDEITVSSAQAPAMAVYRVERKPRVH